MRVDVAVGEVPWERDLLAALTAERDLQVGKRFVDLAAAKDGTGLVVACPSVRGFTEASVTALLARRRLIVVVDSIRPPWLDGFDIDCRNIEDVDFRGLAAECALMDPTPRLQLVRNPDRGRITAFVGVSGGVGVTTLAWTYARNNPDVLLIDCNVAAPAVALLVGNGSRTSTLRSALRELDQRGDVNLRQHARGSGRGSAVLTLSLHGDDRPTVDELARLLVIASEQFAEVVLDGGVLGNSVLEPVLDSIDRLVVVTVATPLGMVRLCGQVATWKGRPGAVVVNRVRASAAGSRHVATAMRNLVEAELGTEPLLVTDRVLECDRGWLTGDWGEMALELPESA